MNDIEFKHESYGTIDISRTTGGARTLFGTDVKHGNTIKLRINGAELIRSINNDWYHTLDRLIEIELSPVQFAEAITNMNTNGVPCTIKYFNGESKKEPPFINKKELFRQEFNEDIKEVSNKINELSKEVEEIINSKKTFTKIDKENILSGLFKIKQELTSNIPFVVECFDKQIERSVSHSKSEVEAYIQYKINSLGLKALQDEGTILELQDSNED